MFNVTQEKDLFLVFPISFSLFVDKFCISDRKKKMTEVIVTLSHIIFIHPISPKKYCVFM